MRSGEEVIVGEGVLAGPDVTAPQINVASGVALGITLLRRVPTRPGDGVRAAARELRAATRRVQTEWAKQKPRAKTDGRPFDSAADATSGGLGDRLAAMAALPAERHPLAPRAGELLDALELRDRSWLKSRYNEQRAQAQRRLDRVAAEGLRGDIDAAAGGGFLSEVEVAHAAYGVALGITATNEDAEENVAIAIAEYGLQLGAQYRAANEEARKAIRAGLRPIDEHRARYARGAPETAAEADGEPVTVVARAAWEASGDHRVRRVSRGEALGGRKGRTVAGSEVGGGRKAGTEAGGELEGGRGDGRRRRNATLMGQGGGSAGR